MEEKYRVPGEFKSLKKITPPFKQRLYFVGILSKYLKDKGIRPVIVGGHALEFYTLGTYATSDIDLISSGYEIIDRLLKSWGFVKTGRHWLYPPLDIEVEIPNSAPEGMDTSKITKVTVKGLEIFIIGVEDLIIDRLNAFVHWKSTADKEWASQLLKLHGKTIDRTYLQKKAKQEGVDEALKGLQK